MAQEIAASTQQMTASTQEVASTTGDLTERANQQALVVRAALSSEPESFGELAEAVRRYQRSRPPSNAAARGGCATHMLAGTSFLRVM